MKTKYVRRVHSANPAPSLETVAGPRVKRLLSAFASLVTLPRAGEHSSSRSLSMATRSSSKVSGLSAPTASTRRRPLIHARQASARAAWRRAKLFA